MKESTEPVFDSSDFPLNSIELIYEEIEIDSDLPIRSTSSLSVHLNFAFYAFLSYHDKNDRIWAMS